MVKSLILFMTMLLWQTGIAQETYNGITPAEVKSALIENADVISGYPANNDGWNKYVGYGLVNAGAAVSSVNENISK